MGDAARACLVWWVAVAVCSAAGALARPEAPNTASCSMLAPGSTEVEASGETAADLRSRGKRAVFSPGHAPAASRSPPLYVELALVADYSLSRHFGGDSARVHDYCRRLAARLDYLYAPLNVRVSLAGVVVWEQGDEVRVTDDLDETLVAFREHRADSRRLAAVPYDAAILLSKRSFVLKNGGRPLPAHGQAYVGGACRGEWACGVARADDDVREAAGVVAHELGHLLGMDDESRSQPCAAACPAHGCLMSTGRGEAWSACSRRLLRDHFHSDGYGCLRNFPRKDSGIDAKHWQPAIQVPNKTSTSLHNYKSPLVPTRGVTVRLLLVLGDSTSLRLRRAGDTRSAADYTASMRDAVNSYFAPLGVTVQLAGWQRLPQPMEDIFRHATADDALYRFLTYVLRWKRRRTVPPHDVAILISDAFPSSDELGHSYGAGVCTAHAAGAARGGRDERSTGVAVARQLARVLGADGACAAPPGGGEGRPACSLRSWRVLKEAKLIHCLS